jgi:hypothetical protein
MCTPSDFVIQVHPVARDQKLTKPTALLTAVLRLLRHRRACRRSERAVPTAAGCCCAVQAFFPFDVRDLVGEGQRRRSASSQNQQV